MFYKKEKERKISEIEFLSRRQREREKKLRPEKKEM
jgi:hypothetical protein